ncbi:hypothetical protein [Cupriavidus sp. 8B]
MARCWTIVATPDAAAAITDEEIDAMYANKPAKEIPDELLRFIFMGLVTRFKEIESEPRRTPCHPIVEKWNVDLSAGYGEIKQLKRSESSVPAFNAITPRMIDRTHTMQALYDKRGAVASTTRFIPSRCRASDGFVPPWRACTWFREIPDVAQTPQAPGLI